MKHFLLLLLIASAFTAFGQRKKQPPITYKTITDKEFSVGDRISLGEVTVVVLPLGKDSIQIPADFSAYRDFIQRNPDMTYRLHMNWKLQGVKYPGRTDRTRDALLTYLNEDGPDEDSTCYIDAFRHTFVKKQPELLKVEIEVIGVRVPNADRSQIDGTIALPQLNVLYRNYNNILEFAAQGVPGNVWLETNGAAVSVSGDQYIARVPSEGPETVTMTLKTLNGKDTVAVTEKTFRVEDLPAPDAYLGSHDGISMYRVGHCDESYYRYMNSIFLKYPPEIPLKVAFDVGETVILVGEKRIVSHGSRLS